MANYLLTQTGEDVQNILNQAPETEAGLQEEVTNREQAVAAEATAREQAVAAEATARADADATLQTAINGKQATIADLADIRSGAAAGATAYQKPATGIPATDMSAGVQASLGKADTALQEHQSLADYATKQAVAAEATARADADAALQTAINDKQDTIADLANIRSGAAAGATAYQKPAPGIPATDMSAGVQASLGKADTALQEHQSLADYATKQEMTAADAELQTAINGKQATIADLAEIRSGAAAGSTAYQKPATGIPATDMSAEVQTSLGKADTALQEHQSLADYATKQELTDAVSDKANASDVYTKSETYSKTEVNELITTPNQGYVSVTATAQTTAVTDLLPATGAADTIYRVGNWDGTQYNDSVYSEYAWNGSAYIKLSTKSQVGEVYDISANHAGTKYADLAAALGTNGANIPQSLQRGGMSIKFVQSSDSKYVQYRLMSETFNTTPANWQGVDDEPTAGSENLVKSGGVKKQIDQLDKQINSRTFTETVTPVLDGYINNQGQVGSASGFVYTDFINIEGVTELSTKLMFGNPVSLAIAFYSDNNESSFISGIGNDGSSVTQNTEKAIDVSTVPTGAKFMRCCAKTQASGAGDSYVRYTITTTGLVQDVAVINQNIEGINQNVNSHSQELSGINQKLDGSETQTTVIPAIEGYIDNEGKVGSANGFIYTDFIDIQGLTELSAKLMFGNNVSLGVAFYSNNTEESFISGIGNDGSSYIQNTEKNIDVSTIPASAKYMRCCAKTAASGAGTSFVTYTVVSGGLIQDVTVINQELNGVETHATITPAIDGYLDNSGIVGSGNGFIHTDFLNIEGITELSAKLLFNNPNSLAIAFYSSNTEESFISGIGHDTGDYTKNTEKTIDISTIPSSAKFIRCCAKTQESGAGNSYVDYTTISGSLVKDVDNLNQEVNSMDSKIEQIRTKIYVKTTDSQLEIVEKLFLARNTGNCDVIFEYGEYTFDDTTFDYLKTLSECRAVGAYEMPLGGNCNYYFNMATIRASSLREYDGHTNVFGCIRKNCGNYSLHDGTIIADANMCYCIHDEGQSTTGSYVHAYYNMTFIQNTSQADSNKCIGGGSGQYASILIDGCSFFNNNTRPLCVCDVSWHGMKTEVEYQSKLEIRIKNSYFSRTFEEQSPTGPNQTAVLLMSCNSLSAAPITITNWTSYVWGNVIR